ncbi:Protein Abitram [Entamoeba marina]
MEPSTTQNNNSNSSRFPNFIERYTKQFYIPDVDTTQTRDQYVFHHSNGLCIIGLAKCHPACNAKNIQINLKVNYDESKKVKGKCKFGGVVLQKNTIVCIITADGIDYEVRAGCNGKLLEINEELINNPTLLQTESEGKGFLAIVQQKLKEKHEEITLTSLEDYCALRKLEIPQYIPLPVANEDCDIDDYS